MTLTLTEGLEPCTLYTYTVYATAGDVGNFGVEGYFTTAADRSATAHLKPFVEQSGDKLVVTWDGRLSCIGKYQVQVCKDEGDCGEQQLVAAPTEGRHISFTTETLDKCSDYDLSIRERSFIT